MAHRWLCWESWVSRSGSLLFVLLVNFLLIDLGILFWLVQVWVSCQRLHAPPPFCIPSFILISFSILRHCSLCFSHVLPFFFLRCLPVWASIRQCLFVMLLVLPLSALTCIGPLCPDAKWQLKIKNKKKKPSSPVCLPCLPGWNYYLGLIAPKRGVLLWHVVNHEVIPHQTYLWLHRWLRGWFSVDFMQLLLVGSWWYYAEWKRKHEGKTAWLGLTEWMFRRSNMSFIRSACMFEWASVCTCVYGRRRANQTSRRGGEIWSRACIYDSGPFTQDDVWAHTHTHTETNGYWSRRWRLIEVPQ